MKGSGSEDDENLVSDDDIPSDIDMNDPYFAEEFKDFKSNPKKAKKRNGTSKSQDDLQQKVKERKKKQRNCITFILLPVGVIAYSPQEKG